MGKLVFGIEGDALYTRFQVWFIDGFDAGDADAGVVEGADLEIVVGLANLGVNHRVVLGTEVEVDSPHRVGDAAAEGGGGEVVGVDSEVVAFAKASQEDEIGVVLHLESHGTAHGQQECDVGVVRRDGHAVVLYRRHMVAAGRLEHGGTVGRFHHEASNAFNAYFLHLVGHLLGVELLGMGN